MPDFFGQPVVCNTGPLLALYRVSQPAAEALLLNGRVEAADNGTARVAQLGDALEGLENNLAGAFRGTEKGRERVAEKGGVADGVITGSVQPAPR